MLARICFAALLWWIPTWPVSAQGGGAAGQWRCRHANQSVSNNRFENWIYEFGLALFPNGGFQAQGSYTAMTAGFSVPLVAQGRWQQSNQGVVVRGSEQRQDGTRQPLTLVFTSVTQGVMSNRFQSAQGILATYCSR
ncbi:hypothetical protein [uncultured Enterovirga sp.]|uniref:hypothetical protein n=1 Tax=uncultured Enterovirga sp. TaxID=2026352 RepID=UPI0035CC3F01